MDRDARVQELLYSCDSREELCERIADLERGRAAKQLVTSDGMTGHAVCSACHGAIDPWDRFCRHCSAKIENPWRPEDET